MRAGGACRSYHEWRDEKEHGASASTSSSGQAPAAAGGGSSSSSGIGGAGAAVADAARDMSREAGDTADATKEVVKMEGRAAGSVVVLVLVCSAALQKWFWSVC